MTEEIDWESDALVRVQDGIWPASRLAARLLSGQGAVDPDAAAACLQALETAARMMQRDGARIMADNGIEIGPEDRAVLTKAAERLETARKTVEAFVANPENAQARSRVQAAVFDQMEPQLEAAINVFRRLAITAMMRERAEHNMHTKTAIDGLDKISKQIFFISINASVEAARAGYAGRGFLQISTDIRALSQSAQEATRNLSNFMVGTQAS